MAEHGGSAEAGEILGIAEQTVKNHLLELRKKTGAKTTLQAYHRLFKGTRVVTTTTVDMRMEVAE